MEIALQSKKLMTRKIQGIHIDRELKIISRKGKHLSGVARALIEAARRLR